MSSHTTLSHTNGGRWDGDPEWDPGKGPLKGPETPKGDPSRDTHHSITHHLRRTPHGETRGTPEGDTHGLPTGTPLRDSLRDSSGTPSGPKRGDPHPPPHRGKGGKRGRKRGGKEGLFSKFSLGEDPQTPPQLGEGADLRSAKRLEGGGARAQRGREDKSDRSRKDEFNGGGGRVVARLYPELRDSKVLRFGWGDSRELVG